MTSSVPVLVRRHIFGVNSKFNSNVAFLDSRIVLYVAGRSIVFYNIEEHSQRFVVGSSPSAENWLSDPEICAICLSPTTRHLAVAERGEKPSVTILDTESLRKKKCITIPSGIRSKDICSLSFTANDLYLAFQCGSPDWKLCVFEWEKGLMLHCISTSKDAVLVHQIQYQAATDDAESHLLAVCHQNCIQLHQQTEKEMTEQKIESAAYQSEHTWTCFCWIADELVCGNSGGDVVVYKHGKFQNKILGKSDHCAITSIQAINDKAVAIGAEDCIITFLHRTTSSNWNCICNINLAESVALDAISSSSLNVDSNRQSVSADSEHPILSASNLPKDTSEDRNKCIPCGMSVDSEQTRLIVTTHNKQIYCMDITHLSKSESEIDTDFTSDCIQKSVSQPLGHFHVADITGMDICIRKPWIVTCSSDKSICIWNYMTRKLELCKYFNTKIYSVSLHPSGLHILAGFEDKLKLLNVLMDDIQPYKDFHIVRACKECTFSHGGHRIAAVNGDKIHIYNTYSGELISILRGHNQKINSLYFSLDDTSLISAGGEGAVYEWCMFNYNRIQEHVNRQCPLNTAIVTKDKKIYCTGNTPLLNEIADSQLEKEVDTGCTEITRLIISHLPQRMIFASTINGLIRSMKFPLTTDHLDYVGHLGKIERIVMSQDDVYLFSCGQDGCINIFEIRDKEGRLPSSQHRQLQSSSIANLSSNKSLLSPSKSETMLYGMERDDWSTEILVTTSYLYEKQQLMTELANKVDELKLHNEYQLRLREMHYQDTLKEKEDKFNQELKQQKLKYEVLKDEQQDLEMEYEEKIKLKEDQHSTQVQQLESFYQTQLITEIDKYSELELLLNSKQNEWEKDTVNKHESHQVAMNNLKEKFESTLNSEIMRTDKLQAEYDLLCREYNETKEQLLDDFDAEIQELEGKYVSILHEERESTLRLKGENGVMKKKFSSLQHEIDDQLEESKKMNVQESNFKKNIGSLKKEIHHLDDEMLSRDNIIGEKEKQIYQLKKKNQNLEKHKFVLDYKIKSLKKQIEPRQNKILAMKDQVKTLDVELETLHTKNGQLKVVINQLNQQMHAVQKVIHAKKEKTKKLQVITSKFGHDLSQIIEHIQDAEKLKHFFVSRMYSKSKKNALLSFVDHTEFDVNKDVLDEYERQRQHLVLCVESLKRELSKQSKLNQKENYEIMRQNVRYMTEMQELRKELKALTQVSSSASANTHELNDTEMTESGSGADTQTQSLRRQIEKQEAEIARLNTEIDLMQTNSHTYTNNNDEE